MYGEAVPVVVEWRRARVDSDEAAQSGTALSRAAARERVLELEIELIEERKLTLPPATYPWDGFGSAGAGVATQTVAEAGADGKGKGGASTAAATRADLRTVAGQGLSGCDSGGCYITAT